MQTWPLFSLLAQVSPVRERYFADLFHTKAI
jgi:hypothetical protein